MLKSHHRGHESGVRAADAHVEEEEEEVSVISEAHAVVHPRTATARRHASPHNTSAAQHTTRKLTPEHPRAPMVVHFQDAAVALAAVVASVGLSLETPLADAHTSKFFPFNRNDYRWALNFLWY